MCLSHIVVNESVREIQQIIVVLTGSNRNGSFVATKNDRTECRSIVLRVLGEIVLSKSEQHIQVKI